MSNYYISSCIDADDDDLRFFPTKEQALKDMKSNPTDEYLGCTPFLIEFKDELPITYISRKGEAKIKLLACAPAALAAPAAPALSRENNNCYLYTCVDYMECEWRLFTTKEQALDYLKLVHANDGHNCDGYILKFEGEYPVARFGKSGKEKRFESSTSYPNEASMMVERLSSHYKKDKDV